MTLEGFTDGAVCLAFVQKVLVPQVRPGHVVVLDNLKAQKVAGLAAAITTTGAPLRYLPPYSPDLSPIEAWWSKVKTVLRTKAARTRETLEEAIAQAFKAVTVSDAQGGFTPAGYWVISN
jgi:transposase